MESVMICFIAWRLTKDEEKLMVVGSDPALGEWDVSRGLTLANLPKGSSQWVGVARLAPGSSHFKLVVSSASGACWEGLPDREVTLPVGTQQALLKCGWDDQQVSLELSQEPVVPSPVCMPGRARLVLPYWRQTIGTEFCFIQKLGHDVIRHRCYYNAREGAAVVTVEVPLDLKLVGVFEVARDGKRELSDERMIQLGPPVADGQIQFQITWPYSRLGDHEITEVKCPNQITEQKPGEPVVTSSEFDDGTNGEPAPSTPEQAERKKKMKDVKCSSENVEEKKEQPAVKSSDISEFDQETDGEPAPSTSEQAEQKKKTRGLHGLVKRVWRFLRRKKQREHIGQRSAI